MHGCSHMVGKYRCEVWLVLFDLLKDYVECHERLNIAAPDNTRTITAFAYQLRHCSGNCRWGNAKTWQVDNQVQHLTNTKTTLSDVSARTLNRKIIQALKRSQVFRHSFKGRRERVSQIKVYVIFIFRHGIRTYRCPNTNTLATLADQIPNRRVLVFARCILLVVLDKSVFGIRYRAMDR